MQPIILAKKHIYQCSNKPLYFDIMNKICSTITNCGALFENLRDTNFDSWIVAPELTKPIVIGENAQDTISS